MKYRSAVIARAFVAALPLYRRREHALLRRFAVFLRKRRLMRQARDILRYVERLLLKERGGRKIVIETAAPLDRAMRALLRRSFKKEDEIEERVVLRLIAGARITMDEEMVIDGTVERKLKKLFR